MNAEQLAELAITAVLANQRDPTHQTAKRVITRAVADALAAQRKHSARIAESAASEYPFDPDQVRERVLAG